ncbi:recombinase family protein [Agrobacterium cavarae]|uniref:recombinase family protein n=1 Tax=Agrobacterium cavarae TaxID=2528239 RepID=UPI00289B6B1D|nr:recombinase family protein [Agrobacterium cavarae]
MKRAAIYARYSTDLQNDKSVEDQIRLCESHAARIGATVSKIFHDRAKSGASMFGRPGLSHLMQEADKGGFDILISESPDRVSRDIADLAHIHKTLKFRDIEMNCVNGGVLDTMQIGMYGVVGQMQREEGAKKVKRGMVGVVRSGRSAGGKAYGYEPVPGKPGELCIVEAEAEVIRRIFKQYVSGLSARMMAGALNDDGIAPPRGTKWNASTINGNGARGNGIIRNPIYDGRLVWNRVRMVKDPSTGKRISRVNDASEHETIEVPHLRIVDEQLFQAAQQRKDRKEHHMPLVRNRRILSGLLRCGGCGGGLAIIGADRSGPRVMCSTNRESGTCNNSGRYYIEKIEQKVLSTLRMQFADTEMVKAYVETYEEETRRVKTDIRRNMASMERQLAEAKQAITRIVEKVAKGLIEDEDAAAILPGLRQERDRLAADIAKAEQPSNVIEFYPVAVRRFKDNIEKLTEILATAGEIPDADSMLIFRQMIASVIIEPRKPGEDYVIEIKGFLSGLIEPDLSAVPVVAGEGLEPPTRGL